MFSLPRGEMPGRAERGRPMIGRCRLTPSASCCKVRRDGSYHFNGIVRMWEPHLEVPLQKTRPARYFVNSMSDLFHESLSVDDIARVFDVMQRAHWHVFQVLTKRPHKAVEYADKLPWPPNVLTALSG